MRVWLLALVVAALFSSSAIAQSSASANSLRSPMVLTGVVYDLHGSVIADATIIVVSSDAARRYATVTNDQGIYKLELPQAVYRVEVSGNLFCPRQIEDFVTLADGEMRLDFVLESGSSHGERCKQRKISRERSRGKTNGKARPIIGAIERKLNVRTKG